MSSRVLKRRHSFRPSARIQYQRREAETRARVDGMEGGEKLQGEIKRKGPLCLCLLSVGKKGEEDTNCYERETGDGGKKTFF